jgi:excisionase family DNA binding protein
MTGSSPLCSQHFFDVPTFAQRLGVSERTCRRIIRAGKIGVLRIEGSIRIPEAELERFLSERFVPAIKVRKHVDPETVMSLVNNIVARRRGRPQISGRGPAA